MPPPLLLAIDIGNTSIAIGVYREEELLATFRIATDQDNLPDEYAMLLLALLRTRGVDPAEVTLEQAMPLLAARAAAPKKGKGRFAKKAPDDAAEAKPAKASKKKAAAPAVAKAKPAAKKRAVKKKTAAPAE